MPNAIVLDRSHQLPAQDTPAFAAVAERFRRAGELERAVSLCRDGLRRFPAHLSARVTLGWALLDLGRYDEAQIELQQVLKRAPDNLAAIRGLAQLHNHHGGEADEVGDFHAAWAIPEPEPEPAAPPADVSTTAAAVAAEPAETSIWQPEVASQPLPAPTPVEAPDPELLAYEAALPVPEWLDRTDYLEDAPPVATSPVQVAEPEPVIVPAAADVAAVEGDRGLVLGGTPETIPTPVPVTAPEIAMAPVEAPHVSAPVASAPAISPAVVDAVVPAPMPAVEPIAAPADEVDIVETLDPELKAMLDAAESDPEPSEEIALDAFTSETDAFAPVADGPALAADPMVEMSSDDIDLGVAALLAEANQLLVPEPAALPAENEAALFGVPAELSEAIAEDEFPPEADYAAPPATNLGGSVELADAPVVAQAFGPLDEFDPAVEPEVAPPPAAAEAASAESAIDLGGPTEPAPDASDVAVKSEGIEAPIVAAELPVAVVEETSPAPAEPVEVVETIVAVPVAVEAAVVTEPVVAPQPIAAAEPVVLPEPIVSAPEPVSAVPEPIVTASAALAETTDSVVAAPDPVPTVSASAVSAEVAVVAQPAVSHEVVAEDPVPMAVEESHGDSVELAVPMPEPAVAAADPLPVHVDVAPPFAADEFASLPAIVEPTHVEPVDPDGEIALDSGVEFEMSQVLQGSDATLEVEPPEAEEPYIDPAVVALEKLLYRVVSLRSRI